MKHSELVDEVVSRTGLKIGVVRAVLGDALASTAKNVFKQRGAVEIPAIGILGVYTKSPVTIKNDNINNGVATLYASRKSVSIASRRKDI